MESIKYWIHKSGTFRNSIFGSRCKESIGLSLLYGIMRSQTIQYSTDIYSSGLVPILTCDVVAQNCNNGIESCRGRSLARISVVIRGFSHCSNCTVVFVLLGKCWHMGKWDCNEVRCLHY